MEMFRYNAHPMGVFINSVVGATDQAAGELAVDLSDLSKTQIGVAQVNARAFATDSGRRDRALRNFILNSQQYEHILTIPNVPNVANDPATAFDFVAVAAG